jgi:hypothetical protein
LKIVVGVYIAVVGNADGVSLKSVWLDDVGGLERILD